MGIKRSIRRLRRLVIAKPIISTVVLLVLILAVLEFTNTTHLLHKQKAVSGTIPSSSIESQNPASSQAQASSNSAGSQAPPAETPKSEPANAADTNAPLLEPSGTYVSSHQPSLSANSSEASSCHTTAGANCTILFTKDGVTKTLATQTTDANGNTFWQWKVKDAGFTAGSWKITVTVTLRSQTKTIDDTLTLDVQP